MVLKSLFAFAIILAPHCGEGRVEKPAPEARISLEQAREAALVRVPGTVMKEELEREDGRWIYSFDIQPGETGTPLKEVHVHAGDGSILRIEDEAPGEPGGADA